MEFLRVEGDYKELGEASVRYRDYLESIKGKLPNEAYDFATAPWHYDPADHRCPHDAWVEDVTVQEECSGKETPRRLRIVACLLGSYHDGHIHLSYANVRTYQLIFGLEPAGSDSHRRSTAGHGDWLIDELRLSDNGGLIHEVVFSSGARWVIECEAIQHSTDIPAVRG